MSRFLWITNPGRLDHARDTTLRRALEAVELGHESHWCDVKSIRLATGSGTRILLMARRILGRETSGPSISLAPPRETTPSEFNSIQYRTDPPVDLAYLHPLQLLVLGACGLKSSIRRSCWRWGARLRLPSWMTSCLRAWSPANGIAWKSSDLKNPVPSSSLSILLRAVGSSCWTGEPRTPGTRAPDSRGGDRPLQSPCAPSALPLRYQRG